MKFKFSTWRRRLKEKPRFSILLMILSALTFVLTGVYLVYVILAATTVTKYFKVYPTGTGSIKSVLLNGAIGTTVNCPTDCYQSYTYTTTETSFKAIPGADYSFFRWRKGTYTTGTNPLKLARTTTETWVAEFLPLIGTTKDLEYANGLVNRYAAACPILAGVTVEFGDARGYQALSYLGSGKIVLDKSHTTKTPYLIYHEIYHMYDQRDNGKTDWGESIPPQTRPTCMPTSMYY